MQSRFKYAFGISGKMIEIDGSYKEGGGQILRMSVAFSSLTKKPVKVFNIRGKRPNPGLRRQHITAIEIVSSLCNGNVKGISLGSQEIEFYPGEIKGGEYYFDIGTAGSITLVLQACILPSLFAEKETHLRIKGGTDVKWSPPWDYFQNVFLAFLKEMGCEIEAYLNSRGYYPAGGGEVDVIIKPCKKLNPVKFEGKVEGIEGVVNIANLPYNIAERIKKSAEEELKKNGFTADIMIEETEAECPGVGFVMWTKGKIMGADGLGEKGKKAEDIGREVSKKLIEEIKSGADLDERAVDQLLPYFALMDEEISFKCKKLSKHAETEMWLIKKFLNVDFEVKKNELYEIKVRKI